MEQPKVIIISKKNGYLKSRAPRPLAFRVGFFKNNLKYIKLDLILRMEL